MKLNIGKFYVVTVCRIEQKRKNNTQLNIEH